LPADMRPTFAIEHLALEEGAAVIAVHGELDAVSSGELRATLELLGLVFGAVVVDLSDLDFCNSRGLQVLQDAHAHLLRTGGRLMLRRPSRLVQRMLEITGLDEVLTVDPPVTNKHDPVG
jgi:anti-sigma B factor antagonist